MAFIGKNPAWNTATHSPQSADPANPVEGMIFYADGTSRAEGFWVYQNSQWVRVGKESGGLDVFYTNDFEEDSVSDLTSGNNATFDGGGTLQGTLADETVSPISKTKSVSYTQAAGSLNDYFHVGSIPLDAKQQQEFITWTFFAQYDGNDDDIIAVVYDDTNNAILDQINIKQTSNSRQYKIISFVPSSCSALKIGFQTAVENSTAELLVDDFELAINEFNAIENRKRQRISHTAGGNTLLDRLGSIRFNTANLITTGDQDLIEIEDDPSNTRTNFNVLEDCTIDIAISGFIVTIGSKFNVTVNGSIIFESGTIAANNSTESLSFTNYPVSAGDQIVIQSNDNVRNTANAFSTFITATTSTIANYEESRVPENNFSARIDNAGSASVISESSPFIDSVSRTGAGLVTVTWTSGFFSEPPHVTGTPIGTTSGAVVQIDSVTATQANIITRNSTFSNADFDFTLNVQRQGNDYRDSRKAFLFLNQTTILKDVKASATDGGGATSGSLQTRVLNTQDNPISWCSLSSNQFTLAPGKYSLDGSAPAKQVGDHIAVIRNITDATTEIIGSSSRADTATDSQTESRISGVLELTESKTFELQHQVETTRASDGFGQAHAFGFSNVYSQLKITRIA